MSWDWNCHAGLAGVTIVVQFRPTPREDPAWRESRHAGAFTIQHRNAIPTPPELIWNWNWQNCNFEIHRQSEQFQTREGLPRHAIPIPRGLPRRADWPDWEVGSNTCSTSFFARGQRAFKLVPKSIKEEEGKKGREKERKRKTKTRTEKTIKKNREE